MKVLIVSDTHGQDENLEETVLREAPFDYLIHCGDVEGREIFIEALAECPCTIVAGNNDFFTDLPYEEEVTLEGHKILVTHGHHYFVSRDYDKLVENAQARTAAFSIRGGRRSGSVQSLRARFSFLRMNSSAKAAVPSMPSTDESMQRW